MKMIRTMRHYKGIYTKIFRLTNLIKCFSSNMALLLLNFLFVFVFDLKINKKIIINYFYATILKKSNAFVILCPTKYIC